MSASRRENAEYVINYIRGLGIRLHPESRFMQMYGLLHKADGIIKQNDPAHKIAVEAERDMQHVRFIIEQAKGDEQSEAFKRLLKILTKDSVLPQQDLQQSKGRDAQAELFVWAICRGAGLAPVEFEEPDISCWVNNMKFGIAVKRVKSKDALEQHVRKAAKQIQRSELPGIIAIDTCRILNQENEPFVTQLADNCFGILYNQLLQEFVEEHHFGIEEWVTGKGVRGIVFHVHLVRWHSGDHWSLQSMTFTVSTAGKDETKNRQFLAFQNAYRLGLPNLTVIG